MLAGRMKLRNFLILAGLVVAGGITALVLTYEPSPPAPAEPAQAFELPGESSPRIEPPKAVTAVAGEDALTTQVRGMAGRTLSGGKGKDVTSGRPYKVNLYQDSGHTQVNRAKVDLNRNEKWDEKWTFEPDGRITRQIAPADDENYTVKRIFENGAWRDE